MKNNGESGSLRNQYYATFVLSLVSLVGGIGFGWLSPILPKLQSDDSPINIRLISDSEASWVVTLTNVGYLIGVGVLAVLADKIGRKRSMYVPLVTFVIGWILIIFPQNLYYLYIARLLIGFSTASVFTTLPIYVSEYSSKRVRGMLTSSTMTVSNLGVLVSFIMCSFTDYYYIAYVTIIICVIFIILFVPIPESPSFLVQQNKLDEADRAYYYFNGVQRGDIQLEEKFLNNELETKVEENLKLTWADFTEKSSIRAILIAIVTCMMMHLCGGIVLMSYMERTFHEAGSNISSVISSIIVSIVQLLGTYISNALVDRAGRKILLSLSSLATGLFLGILGVFVYCKRANMDVEQFDWIPVVCFSGAIFSASCGIYPVPYVMMSEMLPIKLRATVMSACSFLMAILGVFLVKFYLNLIAMLGLHGCLFIFATCCIFEMVFVLMFVPETKGQTVEAIARILSGVK